MVEFTCKICGKDFKAMNGLGLHIKTHDITNEEYYIQYIGEIDCNLCSHCGCVTTFRGIGRGFLKYCSQKCATSSIEFKQRMIAQSKGIKQSNETIQKRVDKINYSEVMEKRKGTMLNKFGVDNYSKLEDVKIKRSNERKGSKNPRVNDEHQGKIIASKIKNNTTKHNEDTKKQIKNKLLDYYQDENNSIVFNTPKSSPYKGVKTGYINGIYYRSSYEKHFIEFCISNNINIESAENKKFMSFYVDEENKKRRYYPDFYLKDFDIIVEIKAKWKISKDILKINSGVNNYISFLLLTQDELFDDEFENNMNCLINNKNDIQKFTINVINKNS